MKTCILLTFFSISLSAVSSEVPQVSDSVQAAEFFEQGYALYRKDRNKVDSARYFFQLSKEGFMETSKEGYGRSIYYIALIDQQNGQMTAAIEGLNQVIEIGRELAESEEKFSLLNQGLLDLGYAQMFSKDYSDANTTLKALLETTSMDKSGPAKETLAYSLLVYNYTQTGQFDSAVFYSSKALEGANALRADTLRNREIFYAIGNAYSGVGDYFGRIGHFSNFKKYNEMQVDFIIEEQGEGHYTLMWPLLGLGNLAFIVSDHIEALELYDQALFIAQSYRDSTSDRFGLIHDKLHQIHSELENWEQSLYHIDQALKVYEVKEHLLLDAYKLYAAKAKILAITGDTKSSENYFQKAVIAFQEETDKFFLNAIAINLTATLSEVEKYDRAIKMSEKALKLGKEIFPERSFEIGQNYYSLGLLHLKNNQLKIAADYLDSAKISNQREDSTIIYTQLAIDIAAVEMQLHEKMVFESGYDQHLAVDRLKEAQKFVAGTKSNLDSDLGQIYEPNNFHNNAINLAARIYFSDPQAVSFEQAFSLAEQNRSFDLKNYIRKADALANRDIPRDLIKRREDLLNAILAKKYQIATIPDLTPRQELELRSAYDSLKRKYDETLEEIAYVAPEYFRYNYEVKTIKLLDLKDKLASENSSLISYYRTDAYLVLFYVSPQSEDLLRIPWTASLENKILSFRESLSDPSLSDSYFSLSEELFNTLLAPVWDQINGERLVIIPDDILNYIPFEVLTLGGEKKYVFEEKTVHYEFSAETFLRNGHRGYGKNMLAMSPTFPGDEKLSEDVVRSEIAALPGAIEEVKAISEIMSAESILGEGATETLFKKTATGFSILHMATHAIIDDQDPNNSRLIFSLKGDTLNDGYLRAYEIYNFSFDADLVTLSACNTGFGKLRKGEGVMSLSRAFAFAGVPASVMSLWPASDKSTPELMTYFYKNLKEGQLKDEALNNARKSYLMNATGKARHPFYWGGFVLIGDPQPISEDSNLLVYLIPGLLIIVMILTVYRRKRKAIS